MNSITQDIVFKQSVVKYFLKHGVTEAVKRYKQHRKTIYRWIEKYYQYTAIDEYTRQRVLWASKEHNTYESTRFLEVVIRKFKYKIECVQTDNGFEFTNRLNAQNSNKKRMFERKLEDLGIRHKLIKPRTPRHNGKVERSHRKDQERFYYERIFVSFEDFKEKLRH